MERRVFLAASTTAALTNSRELAGGNPGDTAAPAPGERPLLLELRRYRLRNGPLEPRR